MSRAKWSIMQLTFWALKKVSLWGSYWPEQEVSMSLCIRSFLIDRQVLKVFIKSIDLIGGVRRMSSLSWSFFVGTIQQYGRTHCCAGGAPSQWLGVLGHSCVGSRTVDCKDQCWYHNLLVLMLIKIHFWPNLLEPLAVLFLMFYILKRSFSTKLNVGDV